MQFAALELKLRQLEAAEHQRQAEAALLLQQAAPPFPGWFVARLPTSKATASAATSCAGFVCLLKCNCLSNRCKSTADYCIIARLQKLVSWVLQAGMSSRHTL